MTTRKATEHDDRLPPHSQEAERGVLGCCLLSPADAMSHCASSLSVGAFYDMRYRLLYINLLAMFDAGDPIDLISVQARLKDLKKLEQCGGIAEISSLQDAVPSAANLTYYADIMREKHRMRRAVVACSDAINRIFDTPGDCDDILDSVQAEIIAVCQDGTTVGHKPINQLVHSAINTIETLHANPGQLAGIGTGFPQFDSMTRGLHGGEMIVIAGRPSMGKTSLGMNIAEHVAVDQQLPVGVFSLEMTAESLVVRMLCSRARVDLHAVSNGGILTHGDISNLTNAAGAVSNKPLYIDDTAGLSILQLRAKARRMWQEHGIKLFVIDYLQLAHSTSRKADNRQQEVTDISSGLKNLAKELNVPVIVLSQLNRELEKDKNRKPRLADLRESGSIEQDADLVCLLYKPAEQDGDDDHAQHAPAFPVNALIAKQRNGPTGDVYLTFLKRYTRFEPRSLPGQETDLPA